MNLGHVKAGQPLFTDLHQRPYYEERFGHHQLQRVIPPERRRDHPARLHSRVGRVEPLRHRASAVAAVFRPVM